jgi:hypothetical protein
MKLANYKSTDVAEINFHNNCVKISALIGPQTRQSHSGQIAKQVRIIATFFERIYE